MIEWMDNEYQLGSAKLWYKELAKMNRYLYTNTNDVDDDDVSDHTHNYAQENR